MEIINAKRWRMVVECETCGSELALAAEDVRYWSNQRTDNSGFDYLCPECGDRPALPVEKLPTVVKDKAVARYRAQSTPR